MNSDKCQGETAYPGVRSFCSKVIVPRQRGIDCSNWANKSITTRQFVPYAYCFSHVISCSLDHSQFKHVDIIELTDVQVERTCQPT